MKKIITPWTELLGAIYLLIIVINQHFVSNSLSVYRYVHQYNSLSKIKNSINRFISVTGNL